MTYGTLIRERAAVHESGHYCVARALGLQPTASTNGHGDGVTKFRGADRSTREGRFALLAVVLAGQAAETLYYRGDTALNGQDYAEAVDLLASWPADEIEQVRREALDAATEALQADWKLVEALAERLRDGGVF